jgi:hypothetical protein
MNSKRYSRFRCGGACFVDRQLPFVLPCLLHNNMQLQCSGKVLHLKSLHLLCCMWLCLPRSHRQLYRVTLVGDPLVSPDGFVSESIEGRPILSASEELAALATAARL